MGSRLALALIPAILVSAAGSAADGQPEWMAEGPHADQDTLSLELPLRAEGAMLFVEVEVGGVPRRFLFDTGSPSMMSAELAAELGLEVVDTRQGQDGQGAVIETEVVQADLTLGGTTLRKVPVFVADFPAPPRCLFEGVLGSEVLPLCAWQIDLPESRLRCETDLARLDHVGAAGAMPLHSFGYPHAPILDIRFAEQATSKALFDTGSPEYFAISAADFAGAERNGAVAAITVGRGSLGGSLGGQGASGEQRRARLATLAIGGARLDGVEAPVRALAPSLIGASVLEHFVVTLDTRTSTAYFDRYRDGPFVRPSYGFSLGFDGAVTAALVWEGSPAAAAGLRPGQRLTSINGRPADTSCDGVRSAMRAMREGGTIDLEWEDGETGAATLARTP